MSSYTKVLISGFSDKFQNWEVKEAAQELIDNKAEVGYKLTITFCYNG